MDIYKLSLNELFKKHKVRKDISYLAKVQTLLSINKLDYDKIILMYNNEIQKNLRFKYEK